MDISIYGENIPFNVDFLFIDTSHDYEQIANEWTLYQHLLQDGAMVVLHDIILNDMSRFWEQLQYEKLETTEDCHSSGFGVFVFHREIETNKEERLRIAQLASTNALSSCKADKNNLGPIWHLKEMLRNLPQQLYKKSK